jgi:histone deacetylase 6
LADFLRNINIPWDDQGMGDGDYIFAFQQVVMPIAQEFDPDLVISKSLFLDCGFF